MNEEQAVLDFFSEAENLPLGLSVAKLMDEVRVRMNNQFWQQLLPLIESSHPQTRAEWVISTTEDRNTHSELLGLHFNLTSNQEIYLRPMIEQQLMGGVWRIYFGLIWSSTPSPAHLNLPEVCLLKTALEKAGLKRNENFLGWQWTKLYPRRQDFLLRLSNDPQTLLEEAAKPLHSLLADFGAALTETNAALRTAPHSMAISLDQLRSRKPAQSSE